MLKLILIPYPLCTAKNLVVLLTKFVGPASTLAVYVPVKPVLATPISFVNAGNTVVVLPGELEQGKVTTADSVIFPFATLVSVMGFTFKGVLLTIPVAGVIDHCTALPAGKFSTV